MLDVNNDGIDDLVSWPRKGTAVLFADWNGSGILDTRTEFMFSLFSKKKRATDLEGLKVFDYEDNGLINAEDRIYESLFIWNDLNNDGQCSNDEVKSLMSISMTLDLKVSKYKEKMVGKLKGNKIEETFKYSAHFVNENGKAVEIIDGNAASMLFKAKIN